MAAGISHRPCSRFWTYKRKSRSATFFQLSTYRYVHSAWNFRTCYAPCTASHRLWWNLLLLLSLSATASCCLYFSHRYLIPVYQSIQRICQKEYDASDTSIAEIDDLFAFLAEQDRINEAALEKIKAENTTAQASLKQLLRFAAIMKQDDVSQQKNKSGIP